MPESWEALNLPLLCQYGQGNPCHTYLVRSVKTRGCVEPLLCLGMTWTGVLPQHLPVSWRCGTGPVQYIISYHAILSTNSLYYSPFHSPLNNRKYKWKQNKSHTFWATHVKLEAYTYNRTTDKITYQLHKRHCRAVEHVVVSPPAKQPGFWSFKEKKIEKPFHTYELRGELNLFYLKSIEETVIKYT